jgi:hypothetical protein
VRWIRNTCVLISLGITEETNEDNVQVCGLIFGSGTDAQIFQKYKSHLKLLGAGKGDTKEVPY